MPVAPIVLARLGSAKDGSITSNGVSFGILKYLCSDPGVRKTMLALPLPRLAVVDRGQRDDVFRPDLRWPVISTNVYAPAERNPDSRPALTLHAGFERRILLWHLSNQAAGTQTEVADHLGSEIGRCVRDIYH